MSRTFLPHVITDDSALGGMVIERSLRFRSSHYLSRTPSGAGSNQMTFSFWVKRGALGSSQTIFSSGENNARAHIYFGSDDKLNCQPFNSSGANTNLVVDRVIRDINSWYHIVLSFNNSAYNDTASTVNVYVNGVSASFTPSVTNTPTGGNRLNDSSGKRIGEMRPDSGNHLNGYLAEFNFIDGQVLDPSYFGFTDTQTGIWKPKRYEGTYGTNGFHLDFGDNSSTAALGIDKSPNGNDWSVSGVEIVLGTHDDSMIDTPTNNFPTFNLSNRSSGPTLDWGNLYFFYNYKPATKTARSTFRLPKSGKYYWEWENNESSSNPGRWQSTIGNVVNIANNSVDVNAANNANFVSYSYGGSTWNGTTHVSASWDGTTRSWYRPQRAAWAVDCDTGNIWVGRVADDATTQWWASDGSATGNPSKLLNPTCAIDKDKTHEYTPMVCWHDGGAAVSTGFAIDINFGQHAFKGTVPDGFKTLSSANIPTDPSINTIVRPKKHFDTLLYTGNGTTGQSITGLEFKPDLVWIKSRSFANNHHLFDTLRGVDKILRSSADEAESTVTDVMSSFNNDGFTVKEGGGNNATNDDGSTFVAWCWKAGGAAVSNTDGDITSSVSVNEEAGFSIATYTGSTASGALTVGHGLGKKPAWVIIKRRDDTSDWIVGHQGLATNAFANNKFLKLEATSSVFTNSLVWGVEPTTTVTQIVTNGAAGAANLTSSGTYVMYSWAEIPGFSKFGSYTGNGSSDGPYIHLGFRPAWTMIKSSSATWNWVMQDTERFGGINSDANDKNLAANSTSAEPSSASFSGNQIDYLSNGFKLRSTAANTNASGGTYIYMAFAEQPDFTNFDTFANAK